MTQGLRRDCESVKGVAIMRENPPHHALHRFAVASQALGHLRGVARSLRAFLIALILALAGCGSPKSRESDVTVYDNRGGFAYPGQRMTFYSSGQYESEGYTDVVDENRRLETGTFTNTDSIYILH